MKFYEPNESHIKRIKKMLSGDPTIKLLKITYPVQADEMLEDVIKKTWHSFVSMLGPELQYYMPGFPVNEYIQMCYEHDSKVDSHEYSIYIDFAERTAAILFYFMSMYSDQSEMLLNEFDTTHLFSDEYEKLVKTAKGWILSVYNDMHREHHDHYTLDSVVASFVIDSVTEENDSILTNISVLARQYTKNNDIEAGYIMRELPKKIRSYLMKLYGADERSRSRATAGMDLSHRNIEKYVSNVKNGITKIFKRLSDKHSTDDYVRFVSIFAYHVMQQFSFLSEIITYEQLEDAVTENIERAVDNAYGDIYSNVIRNEMLRYVEDLTRRYYSNADFPKKKEEEDDEAW